MSQEKTEMTFDNLVGLFKQTQSVMQAQAARSVDTALVVRNWLFGWYIVEYQQNGSDRAAYGTKLLKKLSQVLSHKLGRGFSVDSLELMRKFYAAYQQPGFECKKSETLSRISESISELVSRNLAKQPEPATHMPEIWHSLSVKFTLSWSHYVVLLTIRSMDTRKFYEIEAQGGSWGIRELKRQIRSSLYERLALSRDKEKIETEFDHLVGLWQGRL